MFELKNFENILIILEVSKAFDTVNWNILFRRLKMYGFGTSYIKQINSCLRGAHSMFFAMI